VDLGAELRIPGNAYEAGRGTTTKNNGAIEARHIDISGEITGTGVYESLTRLLSGGVISLADSPGTLTIERDYQQGVLLEIELGGTTADTIIDQGLVFDFPTLPGLDFVHEIIDTGSAQALRMIVISEPKLGDCNGDHMVDAIDLACTTDPALLAQLQQQLDVLPGHIDGRNGVDFGDFLALAANFGQPAPEGFGQSDIDLNGQTDFGDFLALVADFGLGTAVAIPEPSSVSLLILGSIMMGLPRRKRTPAARVGDRTGHPAPLPESERG